MPSGYYSMHEAEVLLLLGTDFPYEAFMPQKQYNRAGRYQSKPSGASCQKIKMGLCGDVKDTLQELLPLVRQKTNDSFLREQLAPLRQGEAKPALGR